MTDILRLVTEADRRTLPTLSQLSTNDMESIWAEVSAYTEHQMMAQKGVHLAGLGTFTFSQQTLDMGNKSTMVQRPIFLVAGKLVQSLGLKQARPLAAVTHLPVVQLNYTAVSTETPFSREVVEGCIRETLQLLVKALVSEQHVFLSFPGIGVLSFKNNKVRMKFSRGFINAMDGTGRLLLTFKNRPGSSASLVSGGLSRLQRPQTVNPITLPAVYSPQPEHKDRDGKCLSPAPDQRNTGGEKEVSRQHQELKSHQTLQPVKTNAVNPSEEWNPEPPVKPTDKCRPNTPVSQSVAAPKVEDPLVNMSCSGHTRAGQELCYLCMQRAKRNVPVYVREERQVDEKTQEKLLLLKEQEKDRQHMEREQAKLNEQREHAKQVAVFNLHMSQKKEQTHCPLYPTSFIFPSRPLTPARKIKQCHYMNELQSQIESRRQHEAQDQQNRLLNEHLDQVQLAQEIALQKAQQLQQKYKRTEHYKRALDTQVGDKKCKELPVCQPDIPLFSNCGTTTRNNESRDRAQKVISDSNFNCLHFY
ncbi:coiled-coil domain-containing protein 81 isoform X2 [Sphaeramia orbicularis]|uniref:Coiled-coil domain containing 81 n=1 Tax=Sphaeramia orbicularis TaxID=375764 RepID=A0A673AQ47_9TELE|nr:coiled-coil domain-containing protein 81 isoform X2 [Sphaeramia orbicularis]